jgi:hypothetical protein
MNTTHEMKTVHEEESYGDDGHIGLRIQLAYPREITREEQNFIRKAADSILQELHVTTCLTDPKKQEEKQEMVKRFRKSITDAGWSSIFIEEMPNQYCGPKCCPHVPWLSVTTAAGHFIMGWRKRVIELRWKDTKVSALSEELFEKEDVTKGAFMIHAWSYEKLTEYLTKLHADFVQKSGGG